MSQTANVIITSIEEDAPRKPTLRKRKVTKKQPKAPSPSPSGSPSPSPEPSPTREPSRDSTGIKEIVKEIPEYILRPSAFKPTPLPEGEKLKGQVNYDAWRYRLNNWLQLNRYSSLINGNWSRPSPPSTRASQRTKLAYQEALIQFIDTDTIVSAGIRQSLEL